MSEFDTSIQSGKMPSAPMLSPVAIKNLQFLTEPLPCIFEDMRVYISRDFRMPR